MVVNDERLDHEESFTHDKAATALPEARHRPALGSGVSNVCKLCFPQLIFV